MRILYVSAAIVPSRTANSVQIMKMCGAFAELGHGVTLLARKPERHDDPFRFYGLKPEFRVRYVPPAAGGGKIRRRVAHWRTRLRARMAAPDLIYARHLRSALTAAASLAVPVVFEAHDLTDDRKGQLSRLFGLPNFRRVVVISEALKEDLLARFPALDPGRVLVAHDGASPPAPPISSPAAPRPPSGRLCVGYVGHLYPGRGMEVIGQLAERCPWADFYVVGGLEEDIAHWRAKLASTPNVKLCGFIPHHETAAYLALFDVALAPYQQRIGTHSGSTHTGRWMSPLKIFEYMSHGKPIIASEFPVLREVLEDGRNALLVPPADIDAWTRALGRLRDDPTLRRQLGQRALQDFEAKYTWRSRARAVLDGL